MTWPAPTDLPEGAATVGNGRFVVLHPLGRGGQCQVLAAWDIRLRMWRALKVLMPKPSRSKKQRQRFTQEAHLLQRLSHPHLVRVIDLADDTDQPWMVMELVEGGSLNQWVQTHGPMPPRLAVQVTLQVAAALQAAHDDGMVHRDVKPSNVLITADGVCKLADFGIAQDDTQRMTRTGDVFGTLGFMAPEQLEDTRGVDARADVYALSATLWFLLTNPSQRDLLRLSGEEAELISRAPEALHGVLRRGMAVEPEARTANVAQLASELEAAVSHLDLDPPDTPPLPVGQTPHLTPLAAVDDLIGSLDDPTFARPATTGLPTDETVVRTTEDPDWVVHEAPREDPLAHLKDPVPPPPPPPPGPGPGPKLLRAMMLPLALVALLGLGCMGGAGWSTWSLRANAAAHGAAHDELHDRLEHERVVLDDLEVLGFDTQVATEAVTHWEGTPNRVTAAAAVRGIAQAAAPILGPTPPDHPDAMMARQRIERLQHALASEQAAHQAWTHASRGVTGRIVGGLGLAPTP